MSEKKPNKVAESLLARTANLSERAKQVNRPSIAEQKPITMPGQLGAFRLEAQEWQDKIRQLEAQVAAQPVVELPLEKIILDPERRRFLPPEQYAELKANLAANPLIHPVVVYEYADGWELLSGYNRVAVYQELNRPTIAARVIDMPDFRKADELALYANLLQTGLTDYEKYQGLEKILRREPDLSQTDLSARTGLPTGTIAKLMRYQALPPVVRYQLDRRPDLLGANAAQQLAKIAEEEGGMVFVNEAFAKLLEGRVTQSQAVGLAARMAATFQGKKKLAHPKDDPMVIYRDDAGKREFCKIYTKGKTVRLECQTEAERDLISRAIVDALAKIKNSLG